MCISKHTKFIRCKWIQNFCFKKNIFFYHKSFKIKPFVNTKIKQEFYRNGNVYLLAIIKYTNKFAKMFLDSLKIFHCILRLLSFQFSNVYHAFQLFILYTFLFTYYYYTRYFPHKFNFFAHLENQNLFYLMSSYIIYVCT